MRKAIRTQADGRGDFYSNLAAQKPGEDGKARQEFREEADINQLLQRYGVGVPQRQPTFGEVDWGIDLHSGMIIVNQVKEAHATLPKSLKKKYPSWQSLLNGMDNGNLRQDLDAEAAAAAKQPEPPAPPAAPAT